MINYGQRCFARESTAVELPFTIFALIADARRTTSACYWERIISLTALPWIQIMAAVATQDVGLYREIIADLLSGKLPYRDRAHREQLAKTLTRSDAQRRLRGRAGNGNGHTSGDGNGCGRGNTSQRDGLLEKIRLGKKIELKAD
jgi:hypothetical protein